MNFDYEKISEVLSILMVGDLENNKQNADSVIRLFGWAYFQNMRLESQLNAPGASASLSQENRQEIEEEIKRWSLLIGILQSILEKNNIK